MNKRDFLKAAALSLATVVVQSGEAVGLNLSAAIPKNYVKLGKLGSFPQARAKLAVGTDRFGKKQSVWVIRNKNTASGFDAKCPHQGVVTKADEKVLSVLLTTLCLLLLAPVFQDLHKLD